MAAHPYMQFYVAEYLADTAHLTPEEHGVYLLLICNYWQTGKPIPKKRLQRLSGLSNDRWTTVEETLEEFFIDNGEAWVHKRIEAELALLAESQAQKAAAGKASAEARKRAKLEKNKQQSNEKATTVQQALSDRTNDRSTNIDKIRIYNKKNHDQRVREVNDLAREALGELMEKSHVGGGAPPTPPPTPNPPSVDKFPMTPDWRPTQAFETILDAAGHGPDLEWILEEFVGFWCQPDKNHDRNQEGWEFGLMKQIRLKSKPGQSGQKNYQNGQTSRENRHSGARVVQSASTYWTPSYVLFTKDEPRTVTEEQRRRTQAAYSAEMAKSMAALGRRSWNRSARGATP